MDPLDRRNSAAAIMRKIGSIILILFGGWMLFGAMRWMSYPDGESKLSALWGLAIAVSMIAAGIALFRKWSR